MVIYIRECPDLEIDAEILGVLNGLEKLYVHTFALSHIYTVDEYRWGYVSVHCILIFPTLDKIKNWEVWGAVEESWFVIHQMSVF